MIDNPLYRFPKSNLAASVSVEALFPGTNSIRNLVDNIGKSITNFTDELAKGFSEIKANFRNKSIGSIGELAKLEYASSLPANVRMKGYLGVKEIGMQVPPGFKGNMSSYINKMNSIFTVIENFGTDYFPKADRYLASLLNDPRKLYSHVSTIDNNLVKDIEDSKTEIANFFGNSSASHLTKFGDIYSSTNEWYDSLSTFSTLIGRINKYSPDKVSKEIDSLSEKADRLILKLKKDNNLNPTQATIKDIANVLYTMAVAYEFYGAYIQFANELYVSIVNINHVMMKV